MKKLTIDIEGMHCASCQINITKSLKKVKNVKNADAQLLSKKAYVDYEGNIDEKELRKAVELAPRADNFREELTVSEKLLK